MLSKTLLTASTLVAVASAQMCATNVSDSFIATIENSTYFDTCAEGVTFNVTTVFDVANFSSTDFFAFCNSSTCLEPLHELMHGIDCLIEYEGSARNLSGEVYDLHHECHEVLEAAESSGAAAHNMASMSGMMSMSGMDMGGDSSSSAAGSSSSDATSVVMTVSSIASVVMAAALLS